MKARETFSASHFREALGQFPTGVCILTASVDCEDIGMTISSFNTLSLCPPLVLFSIGKNAASLPLWMKASGYAVNVLAGGQRELSNRFGQTFGKKWEGVDFDRGYEGAPVLPNVAACFECGPHSTRECGDHILFVAEVKCYRCANEITPLVFAQGQYGVAHGMVSQRVPDSQPLPSKNRGAQC